MHLDGVAEDRLHHAPRLLDGVAFISAKFAQYGLTGVHHNEIGTLEAIQEQRRNGKLKHRVSYEVYDELLEAMIPEAADLVEATMLRRPVAYHKPKGASAKAIR